MLSGLHISLLAIDPPEMISSFLPSAEAHCLVFHHRFNLAISPVEHTASSHRFANCSAGVQHPSRQVCCSAACGLCGGRGCSSRPGGPRQCCMPPILRTGRVCESRADVACILWGSSNYIRGDGVEQRGSGGAVLAAAGGESTQLASTQPASLAALSAVGGDSTQPTSLAPMKLHPRLPPTRVKRTSHVGVINGTAAAATSEIGQVVRDDAAYQGMAPAAKQMTVDTPPLRRQHKLHPQASGTRTESGGGSSMDPLLSRVQQPTPPHRLMRVVLYVTTHLSDAHAKLLLTPCWGDDSPVSFRRRHPALSAAHLHFFVPEERVAWLRTHFPRASASSPRAGTDAGRQGGAVEAMANPSSRRLFRDFDWVIRLNPDVAVLDFSPFYAHMVSGQYDAVVGTCSPGWRVLTDFTVFRPQAIDRERVGWKCPPGIGRLPNAECEMTRILRNASLAGRVKVVYRTQHPRSSTCRITWSGVVLHSHGHREECSTSNSFYLNATRPGRR